MDIGSNIKVYYLGTWYPGLILTVIDELTVDAIVFFIRSDDSVKARTLRSISAWESGDYENYHWILSAH